MPFAGNLRTLPLPDVFQTLNNIKATGVLRLRSSAGSRDVVFQQGEIIGVGFLDKEGREDLELRLALLGIEEGMGERLKGVTWYWTAMQAREHTQRAELDELVHEQAREQLHNLFAWNQAEFAFDEAGPGKHIANELVARSLERPLSIDTATVLLEAAKQQDEWAELRSRIRDEAGVAAMGSSPSLGVQDDTQDSFPATSEESTFHLYLDGEWRGPFARGQIVGLVQTGEVAVETWSYDPQTQERRTLDDLLGDEARRITPEELESLRQAVRAAEGRLAEERAGRAADLAELRGLAGEVLRLARDCEIGDPAISAVVERLSEVVGGDDPSIVALASETVIVALVRHLRDLAGRELSAARRRADELQSRIAAVEAERGVLETQLVDAERRTDEERDTTAQLRERLAAAAADAASLNQELERSRRDPSRASTARISALRSPEDIAAARAAKNDGRTADLERELGRMRAEHAHLLNEVATLQARIDEDRARHEAELEASRALAASLHERAEPDTERINKETDRIGKDTERIGTDTGPFPAADSGLAAEVERLKVLLADAERRASDSAVRRAVDERDRAAAERDAARGDTERLRRDLHQARSEAARGAELAARVAEAERRAATADDRVAAAEARAVEAERALADARVRLERAEEARREQERAAYESARQNTVLELRLRELATRLEEGEARLAELTGLSEQLAEARARASELEGEAAQIRSDLAAIRQTATGKLERAKRRVGELRARLRVAKRDRNAPVPWSSPMTAAFTQAPPQPQAPVPWPSPATAAFAQAPHHPQAQVPWPSPATATFTPAQPWPVSAQAALSPHGEEQSPGTSQRTTSGTFVPMPMPEESSAQRPRVMAMPPQQPPPPAPARTIAGPWRAGLAAAAVLAAGTALLWWGASSAVPICERAIVNGRTEDVLAPIAGTLATPLPVRVGELVRAGQELGVLRNTELDRLRLDTLLRDTLDAQTQAAGAEIALARAQADHERLLRELAALPPPAPPTEPAVSATDVAPAPTPDATREAMVRLRELTAQRIVDLSRSLDEQRTRVRRLEDDAAAEEMRLASLRERRLVAEADGLVWSIADPGQSHPAGRAVFTLIDTASLVIDAELPAGARVQRDDRALVRLGGDTVEAVVLEIDPGPQLTRRFAKSPTVAPGAQRVLLSVRNHAALTDVRTFDRGARIAFTGTDGGLLTWLGVRLRF